MANKEIKITRFDGGIANDIRENDTSKHSYAQNFNTFSYAHRLVPYRSYEAGQDTLNRKINKFLYYNAKLYGRGFISATPSVYDAQVFYKTVFSDGTWTTPSNSSETLSLAQDTYGELFIYYRGFIYGAHRSSTVFKFDVTEAAAFVSSNFSKVAVGNVQGVIHSADDILYVAAKGTQGGIVRATIWSNDNLTWSADAVLILPTGYTITSMCEYGAYLAIACVSDDLLSKSSKVFLWDRVATTWNEQIDWGEGALNVLEELEGRLIGISIQERVNATNLLFNTTVNFKYYAGAQGAIEFVRITGLTSATPISYLGKAKQKVNNRIYFTAIISTPEGASGTAEGVWSVGKNEQGRYSVVNEYQTSDGTTIPTTIDGFFLMGSYIFIAYSDSGSLSGNISKTRDDVAYSNNSIYESIVFDGGDASQTKKLIGVSVTTLPLVSGNSVALKYRTDKDIISDTGTTWTTIFTHTTVDSIAHSAINVEATGVTLPEFKEIQLQLVSTGGAIITGYSFEYEIIPKRLY